MWAAWTKALANYFGLRCVIELQERPARVENVLAGWLTDPEFRTWFTSIRAAVP
jgi:hypothetical protein